VRQYRKQPDVPAFRGNNQHSGRDGDAGQQQDKKASEGGSRGSSAIETGKSCAESAEDQGIKSTCADTRALYIAWQSMKKEGATWAANAINSFQGWALISKDEAGPWTLIDYFNRQK
jgi:hypothetical protein